MARPSQHEPRSNQQGPRVDRQQMPRGNRPLACSRSPHSAVLKPTSDPLSRWQHAWDRIWLVKNNCNGGD